jgi:hypothetical protein
VIAVAMFSLIIGYDAEYLFVVVVLMDLIQSPSGVVGACG